MKWLNLNLETFTIIGNGVTAKSVTNYLLYKQATIINIVSTKPTDNTELLTLESLKGSVVILSPGVSIYHPVLVEAKNKLNKLIIGDIELFALELLKYNYQPKIIGITGTNGKSTVASLTHFLAEKNGILSSLLGNIGKPVLDGLLEFIKTNQYPELIVLEISSFQLESIYSLTLDIATVLNVSQDHLDRYSSFLQYIYTKSKIFKNSKIQLINADDSFVMSMIQPSQKQVFFGKNQYYSCNADNLLIDNKPHFPTKKLQLYGECNYLNTVTAIALLREIGYAMDFQYELSEFYPLKNRINTKEYSGVLYIEDSKATNIAATVACIETIAQPIHLILGGDGKCQDFTQMSIVAKCKSIVLIGKDAKTIYQSISKYNSNIIFAETLESAVFICIKHSIYGDAVVLSPACSSLDMFDNYEHRGLAFMNAVKSYVSDITD